MNSKSVLSRLRFQGVVGAKVAEGRLLSCISAPSSLVVPKGIFVIGDYCFSGQDILSEVYLINDVVEVGIACFANCPKLLRIVCNSSLEKYESALRYGNGAVIEYRKS